MFTYRLTGPKLGGSASQGQNYTFPQQKNDHTRSFGLIPIWVTQQRSFASTSHQSEAESKREQDAEQVPHSISSQQCNETEQEQPKRTSAQQETLQSSQVTASHASQSGTFEKDGHSRSQSPSQLTQPQPSHAASSTTTSSPTTTKPSSPASTFQPRTTFPFPSTTPSWYAGHMARAIRSMPYLLSRYPPPLVIEARDARLPLTSINPVFENILRKAPGSNDTTTTTSHPSNSTSITNNISTDWRSRRLIVYLKKDLVDSRIVQSVMETMKELDPAQSVMFVDTRNDSDLRKVLDWVTKQARKIAKEEEQQLQQELEREQRLTQEQASSSSSSSSGSTTTMKAKVRSQGSKKGLSGAFRYTPTPEEGVRLLILGMPNVGKSSLLNGLRRVGTGKGKAASTAPHPGHTRKLTGTVRISKQGPSKDASQSSGLDPLGRPIKDRRKRNASKHASSEHALVEEESSSASSFVISSTEDEHEQEQQGLSASSSADSQDALSASTSTSAAKQKSKNPPIYVYDTPGIMLPFLGHGESGSERGIKLAITAGIKDSLFDTQLLADYLLFRLNLRYEPTCEGQELPNYVRNLPLPREYLLSTSGNTSPPATDGDDGAIHDGAEGGSDAEAGVGVSAGMGRTNDVRQLLWFLASKAPGSLKKGNVRDLDSAAQFFLHQWRLGKIDLNTELDLSIGTPNSLNNTEELRSRIRTYLLKGDSDQLSAPHTRVDEEVHEENSSFGGGMESKTQAKKKQHQKDVLNRKRRLMQKGIAVGNTSSSRTGQRFSFSKKRPSSAAKKRSKR